MGVEEHYEVRSLNLWKKLVGPIQLIDDLDKVKWKIGAFGHFQVKNMYQHLRSQEDFPS